MKVLILTLALLSVVLAKLVEVEPGVFKETRPVGQLHKYNYAKIKVPVGSKFTIELPMISGTGYMWYLQGSRCLKRIELLDGQDEGTMLPASDTKIVGGPGTQAFTFEAVVPGEDMLVFWLMRTWLKPVHDKSYRIEIKITH